MKKLLLAIAAIVAPFVAPALAADMPLKAPPLAPPAFTWTGLYFGGGIGGAWSRFDEQWPTSDMTFVGGTVLTSNPSAAIFEAHVGYQYQWDRWVLGVEASGGAPFNNMVQQQIFAPGVKPPCTFAPQSCGNELGINYWFDVVGKLGWTFDRWMVYAKGGWGAVQMETKEVICCFPGPATGNPFVNSIDFFFRNQLHDAAVVGGGFEYALSDQLFVGVDYKHYFVKGSTQFSQCGVPFGTTNVGVGPCNPNPGVFRTIINDGGLDMLAARISFRPLADIRK